MFIATVIVSILLALMVTMSAAMKLQKNDKVVEGIHGTVGVPLNMFPVLAGLELAAAAGLIIGLWIAPIGIAAAIGLTVYFLGAIISHIRVGDTKGIGGPMLPLALSIAALVLRLLST
ncbi:MAG: DoxX family protein [Microthrixaceae bacterium]